MQGTPEQVVSLIPRVFDGLFQPGLTMISEPKVGGYTRLEVFCMVHIWAVKHRLTLHITRRSLKKHEMMQSKLSNLDRTIS